MAIPGVAALAAAAVVAGGHSAGAAPKAASGGAGQNVIVVLHDQLGTSPATKAQATTRRSRATSAQDTVLSRLPGAKPTHVKHFSLGNAFSATVTASQAAALAADPAV